MEHLCSYMAYDRNHLSKEAKEYLSFIRYPDETIVDIDKIPDISPDVYRDMMEAYGRDKECIDMKEKILNVWKKYLNSTQTTIALYYSVRTKSVVQLPEEIIGKLCGSNGGGAGNSLAEAIGHGLDEITERYVKYQIYKNRLTPPMIDMDYIFEVNQELYKTIRENEEKYHMKIIVKDASMGKGFTVISVLIIDQKTQKYMVNFGAHPKFEIALERCLTEMFQFYDIGCSDCNHKTMTKWKKYSEKEVNSSRNWISLLRDDTGIVPDSFFSGVPSWEFVPWKKYEKYSNHLGVKDQINVILKNTNEDIYIRNIGFLGFPVYRIYIPGMAVSYININDTVLNISEQCIKIERKLHSKRYSEITKEQIAMLECF